MRKAAEEEEEEMSMPELDKEGLFSDALIRLSVGLEAEADLIEDLAQALYHAGD